MPRIKEQNDVALVDISVRCEVLVEGIDDSGAGGTLVHEENDLRVRDMQTLREESFESLGVVCAAVQ